jgi:ubiquinone/menaquinone biosynthesis C-methylase UbiE
VTWLVHHLQIRPGAIVADLAAGKGKFTRLLLPTGARVIAVEPVREMYQLLHEMLPRVPIVAGTAEAMPIKSSSLDAVCAAQAFHWFDAETTFGELARVVRPGGRVGLAWNACDRAVDWVQRVWATWMTWSAGLRGAIMTNGVIPPWANDATSVPFTVRRSARST